MDRDKVRLRRDRGWSNGIGQGRIGQCWIGSGRDSLGRDIVRSHRS